MEQLTNQKPTTKEKVILELFGIDKKWVWSPTKKWVDIKELQLEDAPVHQISHRKWWQFWKK